MIKVLKKKIVKAKQKASLYHVEFVCDDANELPTPAQYNGWIIDMGSVAHVINTGESYTLNSEGNWILQKKNESEGVTFTEADKEKLDSLTNPIMLKGRVDTVEDLQKIENPKIGWLYFVGLESAKEFAEYIFTEAKKWEFIGFNNIDLSGYVQKTEYNSKVNRFESDISALYTSQQEQNDKIEVNRAALVDILDCGQKNLLDTSKITKVSLNGITLTNNGDGSLTLSGTNPKEADFVMVWNFNEGIISNGTNLTPEQQIRKMNSVSAGDEVVIDYGIQSASDITGFRIQLVGSRDGTATTILASPSPTELKTYQFAESYEYVYFRLLINKSAVLNNVIFKPMICKKALYGISPKFVPYVPSLTELAARIAALESSTASTLLPNDSKLVSIASDQQTSDGGEMT